MIALCETLNILARLLYGVTRGKAPVLISRNEMSAKVVKSRDRYLVKSVEHASRLLSTFRFRRGVAASRGLSPEWAAKKHGVPTAVLVTPENVNHVYPNDDLMLVAPGATG
jgi:hypothetical protein